MNGYKRKQASAKMGITFFFGAGAEQGKENFNICSGEDYLKETVLHVSDERKKLLNSIFKKVGGNKEDNHINAYLTKHIRNFSKANEPL